MNAKIKLPTLKTRERVLDIKNDLSIDDFIEALNEARAAGATTVSAWVDMCHVTITAYRTFSEEEMRDKYIKLLQDKIEQVKTSKESDWV